MTDVTIVIPTYNRPNFLQRILNYYQRCGSPFDIIVADSSSAENKKINKKIVSSFPDLNICYLDNYSEEIYPWNKYADALNYVKSKYVVFCADDDFVVPSGIIECKNFMERNQDYSIVQGIYFRHSFKKRKNGRVELDWITIDSGESVTFNNPSERLKFHLAEHHISTLYGVHKTDNLRFIFKDVIATTSYGRLGEILLSALTLISGKMKILPILYGTRESAGSSVEKKYKFCPYFFLPWSSFLAGDTYKIEYERAVFCLAKNLQKQIDLNQDSATKIAKEALGRYLENVRLKPFEKIRNKLFFLLSKIFPESFLRNLYEGINDVRNKFQSRSSKRQWLDFLEKNDPKFKENLNRIKEVVISQI